MFTKTKGIASKILYSIYGSIFVVLFSIYAIIEKGDMFILLAIVSWLMLITIGIYAVMQKLNTMKIILTPEQISIDYPNKIFINTRIPIPEIDNIQIKEDSYGEKYLAIDAGVKETKISYDMSGEDKEWLLIFIENYISIFNT